MIAQPQKLFILKQESSAEVQQTNISSVLQLTNILKSCLGPKSYQKMLLTKIGTIEMTSDGNSILRELDTSHCATKMLVDLSRTQETVGDGTTSVAVLCGELLKGIVNFINEFHPSEIALALKRTLKGVLNAFERNSYVAEEKHYKWIVDCCLNTKLCQVFEVDLAKLAISACEILTGKSTPGSYAISQIDISSNIVQNTTNSDTKTDIYKFDVKDLKKFTKKTVLRQPVLIDPAMCRIEKLVGDIAQTTLFSGCVINKSLFHAQMRTDIKNPRIIIVQSSLEYRRNESQTHYQFTSPAQFAEAMRLEESTIAKEVEAICKFNPDIVCCEKGISDYALGLFHSKNVTALRRFKKTDLNRLVKLSGAVIVNSSELIAENKVGTTCTAFKAVKINGETFCCFEGPNVCTILLRGPKNYTRELERNFNDAFGVARSLYSDSRVVVGGGSIEYHVSKSLTDIFSEIDAAKKPIKDSSKKYGTIVYTPKEISYFRKQINTQSLYNQLKKTLEVTFNTIPILLTNNAGGSHLKTLAALKELYIEFDKKRSEFNTKNKNKVEYPENFTYGVDGYTGEVKDMKDVILEPISIKLQSVKSIYDMVAMLLRVDGILHGTKHDDKSG